MERLPGNQWPVEFPISYAPTSCNQTGDWRYAKAVYEDKTSPCSEACPAVLNIEAAMALAGCRLFADALDVLLEENPMPAVTGRVCSHPCEEACNRSILGGAMAINAMERFLGDFGPGTRSRGLKRERSPAAKVAIIGSGPAGLSCAYYLANLSHAPTIFEAEGVAGGALRLGIPSYRLPKAVLDGEIERILEAGVELRLNCALGIDFGFEDLGDYKAIFLALGLTESRKLDLPGQELQGVLSGYQFLQSVNLRLSAPKGEVAIVIGGGDVAVDVARSALRCSSRKVSMACVEPREQMPAIKTGLMEAEEEGVEVIVSVAPLRLLASGGKVSGVEFGRVREFKFGEDGSLSVEVEPGSEFVLRADLVIEAIGQELNRAPLDGRFRISRGSIAIDKWCRTSRKGVFAGGDATLQPRTVAHAIASGKRAAVAIDSFLRSKRPPSWAEVAVGRKGGLSMAKYIASLTNGAQLPSRKVVRASGLNLDYFKPQPRPHLKRLSAADALMGFDEVNLALPVDEAFDEAQRCFSCGVCTMCDNCYIFCPDSAIRRKRRGYGYQIDYDHCKGCGICVAECPRGAMTAIWERR